MDRRPMEQVMRMRQVLACGDGATPERLADAACELEPIRRIYMAGEADESIALVDGSGQRTGLTAPRWLVHLTGLRHRAVHILLEWRPSGGEETFVCQVRSWDKFDSPGRIDVTVGGHVRGCTEAMGGAIEEMREEIGLRKTDLVEPLHPVAEYEAPPYEAAERLFLDAEWRILYRGAIATAGMERIAFDDEEVVGLYLCPKSLAKSLLRQRILPVARGLAASLPFFL